MKKEKVMEIVDQCYQIDKIRSVKRYLREAHRVFKELGLHVRDINDLNEVDDDKGDKVISALTTEIKRIELHTIGSKMEFRDASKKLKSDKEKAINNLTSMRRVGDCE